MAGANKYRELKDLALKNMKFKQAGLMDRAIASDELLTGLMSNFQFLKIPRNEWENYLRRGACSVFAVRWLSELLGVSYKTSIRTPDAAGYPLEVARIISHNAFLQQVRPEVFMICMMALHQLDSRPPSHMTSANLKDIVVMPGEFMIACDSSGNPDAAHAIAYSSRNGGMFFDPNAGEYLFLNSSADQKKAFIAKWLEIHMRDQINFDNFDCYAVRRAINLGGHRGTTLPTTRPPHRPEQ